VFQRTGELADPSAARLFDVVVQGPGQRDDHRRDYGQHEPAIEAEAHVADRQDRVADVFVHQVQRVGQRAEEGDPGRARNLYPERQRREGREGHQEHAGDHPPGERHPVLITQVAGERHRAPD
jgi:hypothetical protein